MQARSRGARSHTKQKRKQFPWVIGVLVSGVLIIILVFVLITLLILNSQGIAQGINTLTILSIVAGFVISVLSLLVTFLQWNHPKAPASSDEIMATSRDHWPPPNMSGAPPLDTFLNDPQRERSENMPPLPSAGSRSQRFDWGEAPHVDQFYGRAQELAALSHWVTEDSCRLVAILGMGGIGKTSLVAALVDQMHEPYDAIFWRSLHNAPPLKRVLQECIPFVSGQQRTTFPEEEDRQISLLMESLRTQRCLLVLDNVESILQAGNQAGQYRQGYEGYGSLIRRIGESKHQSCLLVTSREKPPEVALLEGEMLATRSLHLDGLAPADGRAILKDKGLQGTGDDWEALITHYGGNPLALKLVGQVIREVFDGTIPTFLQDGERFFRDVCDVLEQQMKRLSAREEEIVYWLATQREAITLSTLQEHLVHPASRGEIQEALQSLRRRQLIETSATGFTLHHVVTEYLTDCFVDTVFEEIKTGILTFFERHALLLAQAKEYIRETQSRLILQPLLHRLLAIFGREALEQQFQSLLATLREQHDQPPGYAAGNILNLLIQMGCTLRGYDFSCLVVRQAYLQGVDVPEVNFAHANLATSVFTDTFNSIVCVALSRQGDLLAAGTASGEIRIWHAASGLPLQTFRGHSDWVESMTFSPDGKTLASGSADRTVRLWEVGSGKLRGILHHTNGVYSVTFSPGGKTLASGSFDRTVHLWEVSSGKSLHILQGHTDQVDSVAFSPDGSILASGSDDQTVRLWEVSSGKSLKIFKILGHSHDVKSVAFSPNGKTLASGSRDGMVRLWEVSSGKVLHILQGHSHTIRSVAFSPDGKTLASGGADQAVCLWEMSSGRCLTILQGHTNGVRSVAFSPNGKTLASGSFDRTARLWEVSSGKSLHILQGRSHGVRSVAFSPDGKTLASGGDDGTITLWDSQTGACLHTLRSDRPYERMNITGVKGLTEVQKATLRSLGAIEDG
jgi:WD40 repeat protein